MAIPLPGNGVRYMDQRALVQFQMDHDYEMYHWYQNQFGHNPSEQQAMDNHLALLGFGSPQAIVVYTNDEEDSEEANIFERAEDSKDSIDSEVPEYHKDPKDFDQWDDPDNN
ncbi:hypothetical protein FNV43_RR21658 [Rhamnella rubrinervis]|uniref:Uncharacterized protein n=1 Tax=Rhamnella rubrinervis TaxID=2594499 RepID=A0A8K0DSV6_9ROSA|nr:hypothetical protein FNV43_RR21658 [Rhamnella rubrinervis]